MSSGDAARFRDDEYGKSESSSARNDSAHKGEKDKEKMKDKEDRDEGNVELFYSNMWSHCVFPLVSETIKVFDGNCSLRRRIFRAITVPRTCTLEQLLTTALRAFHIAREPTVSMQRSRGFVVHFGSF